MISNIGSLNGFQIQMMNNIGRANRAAAQSRLRLATGKRINLAADDPSGFAFVSRQRAKMASLEQAKQNTERAQSLSSTALGSMSEIEDHILTIRTNAQAALDGGLSQSELESKQLEIDEALDAIDFLVSSTTFGGKKLIEGVGKTTTTSTVTGVNTSQVKEVNLLKTDAAQATQDINVNVNSLATQATLNYSGQKVQHDAEFTITGNSGSATFEVEKDDSLSSLRNAINAVSDDTGVAASLSGNKLTLTSTDYGSSGTVEVDVISGTFSVTGGNGDGTATGAEAEATINGESIVAVGDTFSYRSNDLDVDVVLQPGFGVGPIDPMTVNNTTVHAKSSSFIFQVGAEVGNTARLEIASLATGELGGSLGTLAELRTGGDKSILEGGAADAVSIADDAQAELLTEQTRLGAFIETTLESSMNTLVAQEQSISDAISVVEDADTAEELALQTKNDILAETAMNSLMQGLASFSSIATVFSLMNSGGNPPRTGPFGVSQVRSLID